MCTPNLQSSHCLLPVEDILQKRQKRPFLPLCSCMQDLQLLLRDDEILGRNYWRFILEHEIPVRQTVALRAHRQGQVRMPRYVQPLRSQLGNIAVLLGLQATQSVADGGNPVLNMADVGSAGGAAEDAHWQSRIELLAGLGDTAIGAAIEHSMPTASSPYMRIMLLIYRVNKTLLLWNLLVDVVLALQDELRGRRKPHRNIRPA